MFHGYAFEDVVGGREWLFLSEREGYLGCLGFLLSLELAKGLDFVDNAVGATTELGDELEVCEGVAEGGLDAELAQLLLDFRRRLFHLHKNKLLIYLRFETMVGASHAERVRKQGSAARQHLPPRAPRARAVISLHLSFYPSRIKKCIESVVMEELKDKEYSPARANDDVVHICNRIKAAVRGRHGRIVAQNIPNYKIMVQAVIGELGGQGVRVTSKCLWDSDNDNFSSYTYVNVRGCEGRMGCSARRWCSASTLSDYHLKNMQAKEKLTVADKIRAGAKPVDIVSDDRNWRSYVWNELKCAELW